MRICNYTCISLLVYVYYVYSIISQYLGPVTLSLWTMAVLQKLIMYQLHKCISSIQKYAFGEIESVLCREVVPFLKGPLLEVLQNISILLSCVLNCMYCIYLLTLSLSPLSLSPPPLSILSFLPLSHLLVFPNPMKGIFSLLVHYLMLIMFPILVTLLGVFLVVMCSQGNIHNYCEVHVIIAELEITAGHWPFSEQIADLTEHFTKCQAIVAYQTTR